jgi:hypothetical protein
MRGIDERDGADLDVADEIDDAGDGDRERIGGQRDRPDRDGGRDLGLIVAAVVTAARGYDEGEPEERWRRRRRSRSARNGFSTR